MSFADRFNNRRWFISLRLSEEPISLPCAAGIVPWEREHRSDPDHKPEGCYFCGLADRPFTAADRAIMISMFSSGGRNARPD